VSEQVMVVSREALKGLPEGFVLGMEPTRRLLEAIDKNFKWRERAEAEHDDSDKQVIPYLLVRCGEKWLLTRRTKKQTEARLHDKFSLGVGGHVNPEDAAGGEPEDVAYDADDYIGGCAERELDEELNIETERHRCDITLIGYVNDDSTEVSRHHIGLVFEVTVPEEDAVSVRETENMTGAFATREQIEATIPLMENWSALVAEQYVATAPPAKV
jgi:predicted NUDIX family phosphoesterase